MKNSTNSELIDEIILKIDEIQKSTNRKYWKNGLFPNFRFNKFWFYKRNDNSIFYAASIAVILQNLVEYVSGAHQKIINEVIQKIIQNYPDYQNITGINTYNFYPTNPTKHFGNGLIFRHFKHFQLPDDADDTALIYLSKKENRPNIYWLQNKLAVHANIGKYETGIIDKDFKTLKAYSTWFGKNMPIEFDVVVQCNILNAFLKADAQLNEYCMASWVFIKKAILSGDFRSKPFQVSHNYASPIVIAYHVAKLHKSSQLIGFDDISVVLEQFLNEKLMDTKLSIIEKSMVASSLFYLVQKEANFELGNNYLNEAKKYSFFLAGLLSAYPSAFLQKLAPIPFFHIRWCCEAHSLTLILESLVLSSKKNT
jgi:hypothetical protein